METKKLSLFEASCIITGYGVGSGIMAVPFLVSKTNIVSAFIIIFTAYFISLLLHFMIAEICSVEGNGQIVEIYDKYLFKGRKIITWCLFGILTLVFITNLSVYINGASDIISSLIGLNPFLGKVLFYLFAAFVVAFGLKILGLCEKYAVLVLMLLYLIFIIFSAFAGMHSITLKENHWISNLSLFGIVMFCFASFFSIPQAAKGLHWNRRLIGKSVVIGMGINLIFIIITVITTLLISKRITEVAIIGWSEALGPWANILGSVIILLAMLTSYWSISFAMSNIIEERVHHSLPIVCWLLATVPSFLLSLLNIGGFIEYMELAAGGIGLLVALTIVPVYRSFKKSPDYENRGWSMGRLSNGAFQLIVIIAYGLMTVSVFL
jgi:amino acid permease